MRFGVLGTGAVGNTIAAHLALMGHEVMMGSRAADNPAALAFAAAHQAHAGTFADAARFGELIFLCAAGHAALDVVAAAGAEALAGKILIDVTNPLDFSRGMPPTLFVSGDDSLGERVQRALPATRVVKTLNTVNTSVMVDPARVPGEHTAFLSGDDPEAKAQVAELLRSFGWRHLIDLGDITTARGTEAWLLLWIRLWGNLKTADFNLHIVKAD